MKKENILAIDCFKLVKGAGKSIGIYNLALNLVKNLAITNEKEFDVVVLGNKYNRSDFDIEGIKFIEINKNPLNKVGCIVWELFQAPIYAKKYGANKIVYSRGFSSIIRGIKEYIIIHDMIPFYYNENYPDFFNKLENFYVMWRLKASAKSCKKVITISEASKRDIIKYSGISEEKIEVINNGYNGIKEDFTNVVKEDYIVAVTSGLPHKNAKGIVNAYAKYCEMVSAPLPLKIIGIADVNEYDVKQEIKNNITCYKYIESDYDMHMMIAKARVFMFLSLIEGFGFPPIEAMQLGTPVICADNSSLPEVVGDAAILVNSNDEDCIAIKLNELISSEKIQQHLVDKGYDNIKRFSWNKIVKKYVEFLQK